jgi:putative transposase
MSNRPPRLPDFSYVGQYQYLLTICVHLREPVFTCHSAARLVIDLFLQFASEEKFEVLAYCAMPEHVHFYVVGLEDSSDCRRLVNRWKQKTGLWWKQQSHAEALWQRGFHDRIIREGEPIDGVIRYVILNPVRAGLVADARDYPYSGASGYDINTLLESSSFWSPKWK